MSASRKVPTELEICSLNARELNLGISKKIKFYWFGLIFLLTWNKFYFDLSLSVLCMHIINIFLFSLPGQQHWNRSVAVEHTALQIQEDLHEGQPGDYKCYVLFKTTAG